MFDAVRNNKRIVQIFLVLITLPFAFWGVDSYVKNAGSGGELASIGGAPISQLDFQEAMRDQQERLRNTMGENFNPAMLETAEARKAVLDNSDQPAPACPGCQQDAADGFRSTDARDDCRHPRFSG
jgi:peptidyl-prolyl cis-trans isomerase D